jgi:hypothetical protein
VLKFQISFESEEENPKKEEPKNEEPKNDEPPKEQSSKVIFVEGCY